MSNTPILSKYPPHLEALFQQLDPPMPRLIFAVDATESRQPTWDMAAKLTAEMFRAAAANGGLELQLVHYRGERECTASRWMSDARALTAAMSGVMCAAGPTQIGRVLSHAHTEDRRKKIAAVVLISDACEENPLDLYATARRFDGVPAFLFQEGTDEQVAGIYSAIAAITGGASGRFDAGAAARLADLLRAAAAFATGGRKALAAEKTAAAQLLLTQLK
jgi:hypothetical protein